MAKRKTEKVEVVTVTPPKFCKAVFHLVGTAPLMQARFSQKAMMVIQEKHKAGTQAGSRRKREPRDFEAEAREARHVSTAGWVGVPASALRAAAIAACRVVDLKMTQAKMSIFCEADGYDRVDGTPLVKLDAGDYEVSVMPVRNASGVCDLRARPLWREWKLHPTIVWDAGQFSLEDVTNLLARAGIQVGIGEGRPFSREGIGLGFGTFIVEAVDIITPHDSGGE